MSFVEESLDSIIVDSQRIKSSPLDNNVPVCALLLIFIIRNYEIMLYSE
jgi:hypothetical protein